MTILTHFVSIEVLKTEISENRQLLTSHPGPHPWRKHQTKCKLRLRTGLGPEELLESQVVAHPQDDIVDLPTFLLRFLHEAKSMADAPEDETIVPYLFSCRAWSLWTFCITSRWQRIASLQDMDVRIFAEFRRVGLQ